MLCPYKKTYCYAEYQNNKNGTNKANPTIEWTRDGVTATTANIVALLPTIITAHEAIYTYLFVFILIVYYFRLMKMKKVSFYQFLRDLLETTQKYLGKKRPFLTQKYSNFTQNICFVVVISSKTLNILKIAL